MKTRKLGNGPTVSAIGLGCMSFAGAFGDTDTATSHRCLDAAVDHGITFIDTANVYGAGRSETVIGSWQHPRKHDMVIATKGGIVRDPLYPVNNRPDYLRAELQGSLQRLGLDHVALYYIHRRDPSVPIEDLAGALGMMIKEGLIGGYGLSEVSPATVRRAHAETPCTAVQSEYSLWTRQPELGLLQTTAELGVGFVPFSPLARGVFSDTYPNTATMGAGDFRRQIPRFSTDNYPRNQALIDPFKAFARARGWSVASTALAWVLAQGDHLIPIPGTRTAVHLDEWAGADTITLTAEDLQDIARILPAGFAHGDRYSADQMRTIERYC